MDKTITVVKVNDPLSRLDRTIEVVPYSYLTLSEIKFLNFPEDEEIITSVNGQIVPDEFLKSSYLKVGDCVSFVPVLSGGGDSKGAMRAIAFIAIAVAAAYTGGAAAGLFGGMALEGAGAAGIFGAQAMAIANTVGYLAYAAAVIGITAVGGMMVDKLLPVDAPKTGGGYSQAYSWTPAVTQQQGLPIPKYYGLFRVKGNIISTYTEAKSAGRKKSEEEPAYINAILGISQGPIKRVSDVRINNQSLFPLNYSEYVSGTNSTLTSDDDATASSVNVDVYIRNGHLNQSPIPNFISNKTQYSMNVEIKKANGAYTYTTTGQNFDGLEVDISYPVGIWKENEGSYLHHDVQYAVEIKKIGDSVWTAIATYTEENVTVIDSGYWSLGYWTARPYSSDSLLDLPTNVWVELAKGSTNPDDHEEGEEGTATVVQDIYIDVYGVQIPVASGVSNIYEGNWHFVGVETHVATVVRPYIKEHLKRTKSITLTYSSMNKLPHGTYQVKVTKYSADQNGTSYGDQICLTAVREVIDDAFTYPRVACVAMRAEASSFLNGTFDASVLCEGSLVRVYRADEVVYGGKNYRCISAHTSELAKAPPNSTYWEQKGGSAVCGYDPFTYNSLIAYGLGDEVVGPTDGLNYTCILENTDSNGTRDVLPAPPNETYWSQTGSNAIAHSRSWVANKSYSATASWRIEYSDNPAWVCYDVATQPVIYDSTVRYVIFEGMYYFYRCKRDHISTTTNEPHGGLYKESYWDFLYKSDWAEGGTEWALGQSYTAYSVDRYEGIPTAQLNLSTFQSWADFCDTLVNDENGNQERRITFNGGFDSQNTLWDSILMVCSMGRGIPVWSGYSLSIVIDQAADAVYMFSSGNIVQDSFAEKFLSLSERAGQVQIQFANRDANYNMDTVSYYDPTLDLPNNQVSTTVVGVTKASEAWRMAKLQVAKNLYNNRVVTFNADIDAIRCTVGDVIKFQHDVPQWGNYGGRIVSATATSVELDQDVTLEEGTSYGIAVKLYDDTVVAKSITSEAGTHRTVNISGSFVTTPQEYDLYAVGTLNAETKEFRVLSISRTSDQIATISAIEYYDDVYSVDTGTPPIPPTNYSALKKIRMVESLTLTESVEIIESGALQRSINCTFSVGSDNPLFHKAEIYWRVGGETSWTKDGETYYTNYSISTNVKANTTYEVAVVSVAFDGTKTSLNNFTLVSITTGTSVPATIDLTNFVVTGLEIFGQGHDTVFTGVDCKFSWNPLNYNPSSSAGGEAGGAGSSLAIYNVSYFIEIRDSSDVLRRSLTTKEHTFTYTLDMNESDSANGVAVDSFTFKVKAVDSFGRGTVFSSLSVENKDPSDVVGLTATGIVGGVRFDWTKSIDTDISNYKYRTKVESDEWSSWVSIVSNSVSRYLSDAEIAAYDETSTIYIEVVAEDYFGQTSANAGSANAESSSSTVDVENLFQFTVTTTGTGTSSDLYNGVYDTGGVVI